MRSSLYSILCIVVRVGAILLVMNTLAGLPLAFVSVRSAQFGGGAERTLIGFTDVLVALGIALWLYPGLLARFASGQASHQVFESPLSAAQFQYVAFAVLGVVFAMNALVDLVAIGTRAALTLRMHDPAYAGLQLQEQAMVVAQVAKLMLGVGPAAGSRGLEGALRGIREKGLLQALAEESAGDVDSTKSK